MTFVMLGNKFYYRIPVKIFSFFIFENFSFILSTNKRNHINNHIKLYWPIVSYWNANKKEPKLNLKTRKIQNKNNK